LISVGSVLSRQDEFTTLQSGDRPTRNQSLAILAQIMGWSVSATITRAKLYGHMGTEAARAAIATKSSRFLMGWAQTWAQSSDGEIARSR
jgi:hypothetical protein